MYDASEQLQSLYIADFEMTRLKEIRETSLLKGYLKLEQYVPKELMFVSQQGLKIIVFPSLFGRYLNCFSHLLHLGRRGFGM